MIETRWWFVDQATMLGATETEQEEWIAWLKDRALDRRVFFTTSEEGWTFWWREEEPDA